MQGQVGVDVGEYRFDPRADRDRLIAGIDEARGQARAFVQFDLHDGVGGLVGEGREPRLVDLGPRADAPAPGRLMPRDLLGKAERAHRPGRQMRLAAGAAGRQQQAMLAAALPERRVVRADARPGFCISLPAKRGGWRRPRKWAAPGGVFLCVLTQWTSRRLLEPPPGRARRARPPSPFGGGITSSASRRRPRRCPNGAPARSRFAWRRRCRAAAAPFRRSNSSRPHARRTTARPRY